MKVGQGHQLQWGAAMVVHPHPKYVGLNKEGTPKKELDDRICYSFFFCLARCLP